MSGVQPVHVAVDAGFAIALIEDQEVGEFFLVQNAWDVGQREQAFRHGRKSDEIACLVVAQRAQTDGIAGQRDRTVLRIPYRYRERPAQPRPGLVAPFFPCGQHERGIGRCDRPLRVEPEG